MTARTISTIVGSAKKESLKQDNAPKVSSSDTPKAPLADAPKAPSLEATKAQLPDAVTYPVVAAAVVREPLTSPKTILINLDGLDDSDVEDVYTHILIMRADKRFTFEMSNGMRAFERSLKSKNLFQTEQAA
jgi:hypothetical protein